MDRQINCINFKGLMRHLQNSCSEEQIEKALDGLLNNEAYLVADKYQPQRLSPVTLDHLTDPAYWVSNEFSLKLLGNVRTALPGDDPLFRAGEESARRHLSKSLLSIAKLLSPKHLARHASRLNARFNRTKQVQLTSLSTDSACFELTYLPGIRVTKDVCDWNRGIYAGMAKVAGAKNVICQETRCVLNGDDSCVFLLQWTKPSLWKRFARWLLRPLGRELWDSYEATIQERDNLIQHLAQSEERYRALAENSLTGVYLSREGMFTYANERLAQLLGYPVNEVVGKPVSELLPNQGAMCHETAAGSNDVHLLDEQCRELRLQRPDGHEVWLQVLARGLHNQGERVLMGNVVDISALKRSEQALQESEERFRQLAELLPETIFEMDVKGRITFANRKAFEHFGYSPEDLERGLSAFDMIVPEKRRQVMENTQRLLNGEALGLHEVRALRKDGTTFPAMLNSSVVWRDNQAKGLRGILMDISRSKKLEAQLLHSQKMEAVGTLARGIAHDFNNILAIMLGYTEMALYRSPEGTDLRRYLLAIDGAIKRARDLTRQILTFSKQSKLELRPVKIDQIVEEALKLLRASLPKNIEFQLNFCSDSLVMADPTQIHQVIMNICTNAGHAMREKGGTLVIELSDVHLDASAAARMPDTKKGPHVKLSIRDSGHGMSPEVLEHIFEPFFTTKAQGEGTGLGLAVVHGIVTSLHGAILASSEPGQGTVFNIYLPILVPSMRSDQKLPHTALPVGRERVLLVEDEPALVDIEKLHLESLGYTVEACNDSVEALERFKQRPNDFDLVITDLTMPLMRGDALAMALMEIRPDLPVILCTGFNDKIAESTARHIGIKALLVKPVKREKLAETIRAVLRNELDRATTATGV